MSSVYVSWVSRLANSKKLLDFPHFLSKFVILTVEELILLSKVGNLDLRSLFIEVDFDSLKVLPALIK